MISEIKEKFFEKSFSLKSSSKTFIDAPTAQRGALVGASMIKSFCGECREALFPKSVSLLLCAALAGGAAAHAGDMLLDKSFDQPGEQVFIMPDGVTEVEIDAVGGGGQGQKGNYEDGEIFIVANEIFSEIGQQRGPSNAISTLSKFVIKGPGTVSADFPAQKDLGWGRINVLNYNEVLALKCCTKIEIYLPEEKTYTVVIDAAWGNWPWHGEGRLAVKDVHFRPKAIKSTPGCRGQFSHLPLPNLNGGDEVKIRVGAGGKDGDGEDTIVSVNGVEVMRAAGGKRECGAGTTAAPDGLLGRAGTGGQGGASQGEAGQPGGSGAVKVSYIQPDMMAIFNANTWFNDEMNRFKIELGYGWEHANKVLEQCVNTACDKEPDLAVAVKNIADLSNTLQRSGDALNEALRRFEILFRAVIRKNTDIQKLLLGNLLEADNKATFSFNLLTAEAHN